MGFLCLRLLGPGERPHQPTHHRSWSKCSISSPSLTLNFLPSSSILYSVTVLMFPLMTSLGDGSGAVTGEEARGIYPLVMGTGGNVARERGVPGMEWRFSLTSWQQFRLWARVTSGQRDPLQELAGDTFVCEKEWGRGMRWWSRNSQAKTKGPLE